MSRDPILDIVARTLWAEARSHGIEGMAAVANVIANRVAEPGWWGRGWVGVCKAPWQFSCWNPTDGQASRILSVTVESQSFRDALQVAEDCIKGALPDATSGSDHYYAESIAAPKWAKGKTPKFTFGPTGQRHFFFRLGLDGKRS